MGGLAERERLHHRACGLTRVTDELTRGCAAHDTDGAPAPTGARGRPANPVASSGRCHDWLPARDFHHGPERERSFREAGDTSAV